MPLDLSTIAIAAQRIGIETEVLAAIVQQGAKAKYGAGDFLFHESTPREWLGIVLEGEVEIVRGAQARTTTLITLVPGAVFSEGVMLDASPHASSAVTRQGADDLANRASRAGTGSRRRTGRLLPHCRAAWRHG
jgi:aspartate ammonia-lyase